MNVDELKAIVDKLIMISERGALGAGTVAELAGVSQPAVSGWRSRKKKPDIENIQSLANKLGLNLSQMLVIDNESLLSLVKNYKSNNNVFEVNEPKVNYQSKGTELPLVSDVQAGRIEEAFLNMDEPRMIPTKKHHSSSAYSLQVTGTSMTANDIPTFPEGTIVMADPGMIDNLNDKDFVIAKLDFEDAVTFKQLRYEAGKPYLNPLNSDFPKIFSGFKIIAKVFDIYTENWF